MAQITKEQYINIKAKFDNNRGLLADYASGKLIPSKEEIQFLLVHLAETNKRMQFSAAVLLGSQQLTPDQVPQSLDDVPMTDIVLPADIMPYTKAKEAWEFITPKYMNQLFTGVIDAPPYEKQLVAIMAVYAEYYMIAAQRASFSSTLNVVRNIIQKGTLDG